MPALIKAWDDAPANDPLKSKLSEQIKMLRAWDLRWSEDSVPTSLAVYWGEDIQRALAARREKLRHVVCLNTSAQRFRPSKCSNRSAAASDKLTADFGTWKTPWGDINRFQRLTDDIVHPFTDAGPSIPVAFTSATWGSLASFAARTYNGSKKIYGTSGNSFVAVVEFGPKVRAIAVTAGGESGNPSSKHFNDQATALHHRQLARSLFLSGAIKGSHGTLLSTRTIDRATDEHGSAQIRERILIVNVP